jgi:hypothetical protein
LASKGKLRVDMIEAEIIDADGRAQAGSPVKRTTSSAGKDMWSVALRLDNAVRGRTKARKGAPSSASEPNILAIRWGEHFEIPIRRIHELEFAVLREPDSLHALSFIVLESIMDAQEHDLWIPLEPAGRLHVAVSYLPPEAPVRTRRPRPMMKWSHWRVSCRSFVAPSCHDETLWS